MGASQKWLVLFAGIASVSIFYYFVIYLPSEHRREEVFRKQLECRNQYDKMRSEFSNILGVWYSDIANTCFVTYVDGTGNQQFSTIADFHVIPNR
jgi:hypothetical protein